MKTADLIKIAAEAQKNAHAPYSGFKVGSALFTKRGKVFTGCNVENVSYGDAICAEKVAIIKAISEGIDDFEKIVVFSDAIKPASPCGSCRQILFEFNPDLLVIMASSKGEIVEKKIRDLLPDAFALGSTKKLI